MQNTQTTEYDYSEARAITTTLIRSVSKQEVASLADLHVRLLPNSLQTKLGRAFINLYYESLVATPGFFCDGFFLNSILVGFITYSPSPWRAFRLAFRSRWLSFSLVLLRSILRQPRRFSLVLSVLPFLFGGVCEPGREIEAETLNVAVLPEYRQSRPFYKRTNINVREDLRHHEFAVLKSLGVRRVKAMPEAGNWAVIHSLERGGWKLLGELNRRGKNLALYVKDISA